MRTGKTGYTRRKPYLSACSAGVTDGVANHLIDFQLYETEWRMRKVKDYNTGTLFITIHFNHTLYTDYIVWYIGYTHTFLYYGSSVILIILFLGSSGGCAELQAAAHLKDGHARGHAHT